MSRPQKTAEPGEFVVAEVEGEGWVLGYWPGVGGMVIGRVVGLYRSLS